MALPSAFTIAESIDEAFERCGKNTADLTAQHLISARRSIRLLLAEWNGDSVLHWKVSQGQTHTVALDESSFTPLTGTIDLLNCFVRRDEIDTPINLITREEWTALPDKINASGMPTHAWVERLATSKTVHFYPMAENATDIIVYDAMVYFSDASSLAGAPEMPEQWLEAFVSGLAAKLAQKFARALFRELDDVAGGPGRTWGKDGRTITKYGIARMGDRERGSLQIGCG